MTILNRDFGSIFTLLFSRGTGVQHFKGLFGKEWLCGVFYALAVVQICSSFVVIAFALGWVDLEMTFSRVFMGFLKYSGI